MAGPREPAVERQCRFGRKETSLLERLRRVKRAQGKITGADVARTAGDIGLPRAHVWGTATFFEELGVRPCGLRHVQVCAGTACFAASGGRHISAVERMLGVNRGDCADDGSTSIQPVYCLGYCYGGPAALDEGRPCVGKDLVDQLTGRAPRRDPPIPVYSAVDEPVLLAGVRGEAKPWSIWPLIVRDADAPTRVLHEVRSSELRGREVLASPWLISGQQRVSVKPSIATS